MASFPFDPNAGHIFATFSSRFSFLQDNKQANTYFRLKAQRVHDVTMLNRVRKYDLKLSITIY